MSTFPAINDSLRHRTDSAYRIVRDYAFWTAGFGLLPLPFIDFAAITATQVKMVHALAEHYSVDDRDGRAWPRERTRALVSSVIGSAVPVATGSGLGSLLKAIPLVGTALGTVATPALAWASTLALGRVFIEHFETGGTLLDFDPEKVRKYYYEQFEAAKHGDDRLRDGPVSDGGVGASGAVGTGTTGAGGAGGKRAMAAG